MSAASSQSTNVSSGATDDATIRARIETLVREELDCGHVTVAVEQGRAVLAGTVVELEEKIAVEKIAAGVDGVREVENRIAVRGTC